MLRKERYKRFITYFKENFSQAETELAYNNPFELLVAVILSAQCTDKRVNLTTPALFATYPTPKELSEATFDEVFPYIKSISYNSNKTRFLIAMSKKLVENHGAQVPATMEELILLDGVGRKTANVILSVLYDQPAMAVDTHVYRVSRRLGLVPLTAKTPLLVEKHLMKNIPTENVATAHHWLILHGRYVCVARSPKCPECALSDFCKTFEKNEKIKAITN